MDFMVQSQNEAYKTVQKLSQKIHGQTKKMGSDRTIAPLICHCSWLYTLWLYLTR